MSRQHDRRFSDEELTAFLDGELAPEAMTRIRAALDRDRALARRIAMLRLDPDTLRGGFAPLLDMAGQRDLGRFLANAAEARDTCGRPERPVRKWQLWERAGIASHAVALIAGAALVWILSSAGSDRSVVPGPGLPGQSADWRMEVAHYQALYVPETLTPIPSDPTRLKEEFSRAGRALGIDLDPDDFTEIGDLRLRRAQVLGFAGMPLVQIAFTLPDGTPVAFCILRRPGPERQVETDVLLGLAAASWRSPSHGFVVIGGDDPQLMQRIAQELRRRL